MSERSLISPSTRRVAAGGFGVLLVVGGCSLFDPELYKEARAEEMLSDQCSDRDVPVYMSSVKPFQIDVDEGDNSWEVASCVEGGAPGRDGFAAIDLLRNQRLHVWVKARGSWDPILYVVDSCDERLCQPLNTAARCPNHQEYLSFSAPHDGRYFIGVDGAEAGGAIGDMLILTPQCGDGDKEQGEACDDGNLDRGDGCDAFCRIELAPHDTEHEVNDDVLSGNVLSMGGAGGLVRGALVACDSDVFTFIVDHKASLNVRVRDRQGAPCDPASPAMSLELYAGSDLWASSAPGPCPSLEHVALEPASDDTAAPAADTTYHAVLRSASPSMTASVGYTLQVELAP